MDKDMRNFLINVSIKEIILMENQKELEGIAGLMESFMKVSG
jgi:hypothetical protein